MGRQHCTSGVEVSEERLATTYLSDDDRMSDEATGSDAVCEVTADLTRLPFRVFVLETVLEWAPMLLLA
jgi:hypothetical protein